MIDNINKEKVILDQNIGNETIQTLLEGDIIVPDIKPDMSLMLQADAQISIDKIEVSQDRVNYIGRLNIQILYISRTNDKAIHNISVVVPVDDFVNMEGLSKDIWVEVRADIQNIDYNMINDRKISYKSVVDINVIADKAICYDVVTNIEGLAENHQKKIDLNLNKSVSNMADRFIIKDEIELSSGKPNIREILQSNIDISNQDVRVSNGKVTVTGELVITILYKGDSDDSVIEFLENEVPFNGVIDIQEVREDMFANVLLNLQDKYIQVKQDSDGEDRVIDIEVSLGAIVRVNTQESVEVLEDAYCINKKLSMERSNISYPKLICRNKNQSNIKEIIQLDNNSPDILQIFRGKGKSHLDDVKVVNDKVIVEGVIETDILYVAESDDTPLYSYKTMIPYRQVIETRGSLPNMDVKVDVIIDHILFNMLSGKEIEIRFVISFNTNVFKNEEKSMIVDINFEDLEQSIIDNIPSIAVYIVQNEDTLWKIAKKYNTSIDDILSVNELEDVEKVYPGQKLLILKNVSLL